MLRIYFKSLNDDGVVIGFAKSIVKFVNGSVEVPCSLLILLQKLSSGSRIMIMHELRTLKATFYLLLHVLNVPVERGLLFIKSLYVHINVVLFL
jgi:hypothetical protein